MQKQAKIEIEYDIEIDAGRLNLEYQVSEIDDIVYDTNEDLFNAIRNLIKTKRQVGLQSLRVKRSSAVMNLWHLDKNGEPINEISLSYFAEKKRSNSRAISYSLRDNTNSIILFQKEEKVK